MSDKTWGRTWSGEVFHNFTNDGVAECRKNIQRGTNLRTREAAEKSATAHLGFRMCTRCIKKDDASQAHIKANMVSVNEYDQVCEGSIRVAAEQVAKLPAEIQGEVMESLLRSPAEELAILFPAEPIENSRVRTDELASGDRVWHPYDMAVFTVASVASDASAQKLRFHNRTADKNESGLRVTGRDDQGETVLVDVAPSYTWLRESVAPAEQAPEPVDMDALHAEAEAMDAVETLAAETGVAVDSVWVPKETNCRSHEISHKISHVTVTHLWPRDGDDESYVSYTMHHINDGKSYPSIPRVSSTMSRFKAMYEPRS